MTEEEIGAKWFEFETMFRTFQVVIEYELSDEGLGVAVVTDHNKDFTHPDYENMDDDSLDIFFDEITDLTRKHLVKVHNALKTCLKS